MLNFKDDLTYGFAKTNLWGHCPCDRQDVARFCGGRSRLKLFGVETLISVAYFFNIRRIRSQFRLYRPQKCWKCPGQIDFVIRLLFCCSKFVTDVLNDWHVRSMMTDPSPCIECAHCWCSGPTVDHTQFGQVGSLVLMSFQDKPGTKQTNHKNFRNMNAAKIELRWKDTEMPHTGSKYRHPTFVTWEWFPCRKYFPKASGTAVVATSEHESRWHKGLEG